MSAQLATPTRSQKTVFMALLSLALGVVLIVATHRRDDHSGQKLPFVPPPKEIKHFHFGYAETMADVFWIRALQDFFICDRAIENLNHTATDKCEQSWVFQMLDLVTDLAPKFGMPYYYGATVLSVIVNDPQGAKVIFDKGVRELPKAWDIAYRAAYHYLIELKDSDGAARLLVQAGENGAPAWVFSLAGRLYSEEGKTFLAKSVLASALEAQLKATTPDEVAIYKIRQRLEQIEKEKAAEAASSVPSPQAPKKSQ